MCIQVGLAIGMEARGGHNGYVHEGERGHNENGVGITMYAPNMNMVSQFNRTISYTCLFSIKDTLPYAKFAIS